MTGSILKQAPNTLKVERNANLMIQNVHVFGVSPFSSDKISPQQQTTAVFTI